MGRRQIVALLREGQHQIEIAAGSHLGSDGEGDVLAFLNRVVIGGYGQGRLGSDGEAHMLNSLPIREQGVAQGEHLQCGSARLFGPDGQGEAALAWRNGIGPAELIDILGQDDETSVNAGAE